MERLGYNLWNRCFSNKFQIRALETPVYMRQTMIEKENRYGNVMLHGMIDE